MTNRSLALLLIPLACLGAACSAHRRAGTGDVAFRLLWQGDSDLDLYVVDPTGACIFFGNPSSPSGGVLDVDCNAGTDRLCVHPIENVFWPPGTAPAGTYTYWVDANSLIEQEAPLPFELQLLRGREVVWRQEGEIRQYRQEPGVFALDFSRDRRRTLPIPIGVERDVEGNWSNDSLGCHLFLRHEEKPAAAGDSQQTPGEVLRNGGPARR